MIKENNATKKNRIRKDNIVKKLKGKIMKCLYNILNESIEKGDIKQIDYKFIANVTKKFNIKLLKEKICRILSFDKDNKKIIQDNDYNEKFKKIMNMTLNNFINKIFVMKSNEFIKEYGFNSPYLFENLIKTVKKEEYKIMKKILEKKFLTYFQKLHGRKLKNNLIDEYDNQIKNQSKESNVNETNQNTLSNVNETNQNTLSNINETNQNTLSNPNENNQNTLSNINEANQNTLSNPNEINQNTLSNPNEIFINSYEYEQDNTFNENDLNISLFNNITTEILYNKNDDIIFKL